MMRADRGDLWRGAARQGETGPAAPCLIRGHSVNPDTTPFISAIVFGEHGEIDVAERVGLVASTRPQRARRRRSGRLWSALRGGVAPVTTDTGAEYARTEILNKQ